MPACTNCEEGVVFRKSIALAHFDPGWMGPGCTLPCVNGSQFPMDSGICVCDHFLCFDGPSCSRECSNHGKCLGSECSCDKGMPEFFSRSLFHDIVRMVGSAM